MLYKILLFPNQKRSKSPVYLWYLLLVITNANRDESKQIETEQSIWLE